MWGVFVYLKRKCCNGGVLQECGIDAQFKGALFYESVYCYISMLSDGFQEAFDQGLNAVLMIGFLMVQYVQRVHHLACHT
jgi:hypothetical protein